MQYPIQFTFLSLCPDRFIAEFYKILKGKLISILLKLLHETESEVMLPNSLKESSITLITKLDRKTKQRQV